jgi:hypothetical protein
MCLQSARKFHQDTAGYRRVGTRLGQQCVQVLLSGDCAEAVGLATRVRTRDGSRHRSARMLAKPGNVAADILLLDHRGRVNAVLLLHVLRELEGSPSAPSSSHP